MTDPLLKSTPASRLLSTCLWDKMDQRYGGAAEVVNAELNLIRGRRPDADADNLTGLALSGGGIRSATFSLGVMQALAHKDWLKKFDYLSTVSGGGYIGTSLSWLLHKPAWYYRDDGKQTEVTFGLGPEDFPYKTQPLWDAESTPVKPVASGDGKAVPAQVKGSMLRWLRQHAKYLTPGGSHTLTTLIGVFLRSSIPNLLYYFAPLVLVLIPFIAAGTFAKVDWFFQDARPLAPGWMILSAWLAIGFAAASLLYAFLTFWMRTKESRRVRNALSNRYLWRRYAERACKWLLSLILLTLGLGIIPLIPEGVAGIFALNKDTVSDLLGTLSTALGIGSSLLVFLRSKQQTPKSSNALAIFAATTLLCGFVLLAYQTADWILYSGSGMDAPRYLLLAALLLVTTLAFFNNLNYMSVHRYYRDRLMETFMPDVANAVKTSDNDPAASFVANCTAIQNTVDGDKPLRGPYHLINTNVILADSKRPKFKSRGGDNFILSPLYCGSNATHWRTSDKFMNGGMTLATAMAISGAAVNPRAGCGGQGVTRNPLVSTLMGLLNIRLGYWALNPSWKRPVRRFLPNAIWPGLGELVFNNYLNEDRKYIQLSDGGHFENLALYELIRRRLKLIIVCDGGADPDYTFGDLANVIEKVRTDFGAQIFVDDKQLGELVPRQDGGSATAEPWNAFAKRGFLVADIVYAKLPDQKKSSTGTLIYLTTTFTRDLGAELYSYRREHDAFPDEPTSDQFFDERQFEAYRELGFRLTWSMLHSSEAGDRLRDIAAGAGVPATRREPKRDSAARQGELLGERDMAADPNRAGPLPSGGEANKP